MVLSCFVYGLCRFCSKSDPLSVVFLVTTGAQVLKKAI